MSYHGDWFPSIDRRTDLSTVIAELPIIRCVLLLCAITLCGCVSPGQSRYPDCHTTSTAAFFSHDIDLRPLQVWSVEAMPLVAVELANRSDRAMRIEHGDVENLLHSMLIRIPDGSWVEAFQSRGRVDIDVFRDETVELLPHNSSRIMIRMQFVTINNMVVLKHQIGPDSKIIEAKVAGELLYNRNTTVDSDCAHGSWAGTILLCTHADPR